MIVKKTAMEGVLLTCDCTLGHWITGISFAQPIATLHQNVMPFLV